MAGLAEKGFGTQQLAEMQRIIDGEKSNIYYVLAHYAEIGVTELDQDKLSPLLRLKYSDSLTDAWKELGKPAEVGKIFVAVQKYLYHGQPGVI